MFSRFRRHLEVAGRTVCQYHHEACSIAVRIWKRVPDGGEVDVTPETLITPLARDEAALRGITLRMVTSREMGISPASITGPVNSEPPARVVAICRRPRRLRTQGNN